MPTTLTAHFDTRREAEMTVERLVQEYGIDRQSIAIAAAGPRNSAGVEEAGADIGAGEPSSDERSDAPLNGAIAVSVEVDDDMEATVRTAFAEFDASDVAED
jgi:hypothetical protein